MATLNFTVLTPVIDVLRSSPNNHRQRHVSCLPCVCYTRESEKHWAVGTLQDFTFRPYVVVIIVQHASNFGSAFGKSGIIKTFQKRLELH